MLDTSQYTKIIEYLSIAKQNRNPQNVTWKIFHAENSASCHDTITGTGLALLQKTGENM